MKSLEALHLLFNLLCLLRVRSSLFNGISVGHRLNSTGGNFPRDILHQSAFAYEFNSNDTIHYFDGGTTTGKCNVMGYWHIGNTDPAFPSPSNSVKTIDTDICTDVCRVSSCGFDSKVSPRVNYVSRFPRSPLVDFAVIETPFSDADYVAYPDLQMYPAFAGAVVPIYDIPELRGVSERLVFSRSTLTDIFLGKISHWNDTRILSDQVSVLLSSSLAQISAPINVVVRHDSSGISKVFVQSLNSFDPATGVSPDYSFANTVGKTSNPSKPLWCDPLTDEVQVYTVSGCSGTSQLKNVRMQIIDPNFSIRELNWACDASATELKNAFFTQVQMEVVVKKILVSSSPQSSWSYRVGLADSRLVAKNWYQPRIISLGGGNNAQLKVDVVSLQEGGFWNTHFAISDYYETPAIQSIFLPRQYALLFTLSYEGTATAQMDSSASSNSSSAIKVMLNAAVAGLVSGVIRIPHSNGLDEYQVTFNSTGSFSTDIKMLDVSAVFKAATTVSGVAYPSGSSASAFVHVSELLGWDNFPRFQDLSFDGVESGGKWTCYKRSLSYEPFSYYSAALNDLDAQVSLHLYSIGYTSLNDAIGYSNDYASMINRAGTIVTASYEALSYAVMEKGGDLDAHMNSGLVDGGSHLSWPMSSYLYFALRLQSHVGSCARRTAAMKFIYDFYFSEIVKDIADGLGFSLLPEFLRDKIVDKMVKEVMCSDGTRALASYHIEQTPIHSMAAFVPILRTYLSSFKPIDPNVVWDLRTKYHSSDVLASYKANPDDSVGIFTLFSSGQDKLKHLTANSKFTTSEFAHIAIAILYRISHFDKSATSRLRVTPDILAGIFDGTIKHWNHSLIQSANYENRMHLPYLEIKPIVRSVKSDTNSIFLRFLSMKSSSFKSAYPQQTDHGSVPFETRIDADRLVDAENNDEVDSAVRYFDGSIGYFLLIKNPHSHIAGICRDANACTQDDAIVPDNGGVSIEACVTDLKTLVNPSGQLRSHDLMLSSAPGCYPILSTVDFTIFTGESTSCPHEPVFDVSQGYETKFQQRHVFTRVKFAEWLFSGENIVKPLLHNQIDPIHPKAIKIMRRKVCDIKCKARELGYAFCGYRDCTWEGGDYHQHVSSCDSAKQTRKVSYWLMNGSSCLQHKVGVLKGAEIACEYTPYSSALGIFECTLSAFGTFVCALILSVTYYYRRDPVLKKSQMIFIYIFITGAILLNMTVYVMIGPDTNLNCLLRPWLFNVSATAMFAPLVMKLHRVDILFNNKLKKIKVTNMTVLLQVASLLLLDVIILVLWTAIDTPKSVPKLNQYPSVLDSVEDNVCNTGLGTLFENIMLGYKILLMLLAGIKAVRTWHIPSDISEAKMFALAIYNIAVVGSIGYFLGAALGASDIKIGTLLRCIGISVSATAAVLIIMGPKLLKVEAVQLLVFHEVRKAKRMLEDDSGSGSGSGTTKKTTAGASKLSDLDKSSEGSGFGSGSIYPSGGRRSESSVLPDDYQMDSVTSKIDVLDSISELPVLLKETNLS